VTTRVRSAPARSDRLAALLEHLRVPLYRDGYALVLNSGLTALLGLVYWLLAAREYTPHAVGVNTAAISAMMFLAGVGQLNLISALLRFVPVLGRLRRRFVATCYVVAVSAGVGCAAVFLLGLHLWAPALGALGSDPAMIAWFAAATAVYAIFALQDSALTALGSAVLVPVENVVYGLAKVALLVVLASASPRYGIFGSWTAALLVTVIPVNALIFGVLLRRPAPSGGSSPVPTRAEIVRFAAPDYVGALLWLAAATLMPVIVVAVSGATANAFFSLAWMITLPLIAVSSSTGQALVVTSAGDPDQLALYARKVLRQTARMVVPAAVVIALAAPLILRLFGPAYAEHGSTTLSLLALSAIPNMITALHVSIYRVQRRMRAVVTLLAALCGSVLLIGTALLVVIGIAGVALAWLVCQTTVALVLLRVDSTLAGTGRLGRLATRAQAGLLDGLRRQRARRMCHRNARALAVCLPDDLALTAVEPAVNDVAVGRADQAGRETVVKLALSDKAAGALWRSADALRALAGDERLDGWAITRPDVLAVGLSNSRSYVLESPLGGVPVARRLAQGAAPEPLTRAAVDAIDGLHRRTAETVTVDSALLERWVRDPVRAVSGSVAGSAARTRALGELEQELWSGLAGRQMRVTWIHGDFVPENVLTDPHDGDRVTGIIDWELAAARDLPALDVTMFLLALRSRLESRELGHVVAAAATNGGSNRPLADALAELEPGLADPDERRRLILLCWLRHIAALLTKSERYARHPVWKRHNVYHVLDRLGDK
jgi:O-antigen/teichoic acid export membrane protein